jgi:hypothetical protein
LAVAALPVDTTFGVIARIIIVGFIHVDTGAIDAISYVVSSGPHVYIVFASSWRII